MSSELLLLLRPTSGAGCSAAGKWMMFWQLIFCGASNFSGDSHADAPLGQGCGGEVLGSCRSEGTLISLKANNVLKFGWFSMWFCFNNDANPLFLL